MATVAASYIQTNVSVIVFLVLLLFQSFSRNIGTTTSQLYFRLLAVATAVMALADLVSGAMRGLQNTMVCSIANATYILMFPVISYIWAFYVETETRTLLEMGKKRHNILLDIPMFAVIALVISNPFTHWVYRFVYDESINAYVYERGSWLFITWLVTIFYFVYSLLLFANCFVKEKSKYKKNKLLPLVIFLFAPFLGSILQAFFYGLSSIQIGITLSLVYLHTTTQRNLISSDPLTGINNRGELELFFETKYQNADQYEEVFCFMMDVNHFKKINDTYGHNVGDEALKDVANVLRNACEKYGQRCFLARYGGDEFVIVGVGTNRDQINNLRDEIHKEVAIANETLKRPYGLSISIGCASGEKKDYDSYEMLLSIADDAMYREKEKFGATREK